MSLINLFTFLIPVESGERISYSITCLLAIAVFLTLVSDNLPKSSQPMSVMCYYLMSILIISVLICLAIILNLNVYFTEDDTHAPDWCEHFDWCEPFVRVLLCRCKARGGKRSIQKELKWDSDANSSSISSRPRFSMHDNKMLHHKIGIADEMSRTSKGKAKVKTVSWKEVSYAVDRICLLSFTVVTVMVTGIFFGIMNNNGW